MRLPSNVVAKLYLAGLAVSAACEPAYKPEACENPTIVVESQDEPLDQVVRGTNDEMPRVARKTPEQLPAVAPRYPEPQQAMPQPSQQLPQPVIKKKPKRQVWASICGHAPTLMDSDASMIRCGKG